MKTFKLFILILALSMGAAFAAVESASGAQDTAVVTINSINYTVISSSESGAVIGTTSVQDAAVEGGAVSITSTVEMPVMVSTTAVYIGSSPVATAAGAAIREVSTSVSTSAGPVDVSIVSEAGGVKIVEAASLVMPSINVTLSSASNIVVSGDVMYIESAGIRDEISVMPSQAIALAQASASTSTVQLVSEAGQAKYKVQESKPVKILWFIPAVMEVISTIDATSSTIDSVETPWWSFLASAVSSQ